MEPDGVAVGVPVVDGVGLPVVAGEDEAPVSLVTVPAAVFAEFYGSSRERLVRGLALTRGDSHLAAEAVDKAMARAYQRWERVGGFDDPAAWVYRVGLNWASSLLRRRRRAPKPLLDRDAEGFEPVGEPTVKAALAELGEGAAVRADLPVLPGHV